MERSIRLKSPRLAAALVLLALPSFGRQDTEASLTIRFPDGSSSFRVGQVIRIELSFRASAAETYTFNTRSYDRSGRLDFEHFDLSPAGRDPLHNYYEDSLSGAFMGGGLFTVEYLSKEPRALLENLNEWVALDNPGHYTLRVRSGRVTRRAEPANQPVVLTSNLLELDVAPAEKEWQEQTLDRARADLDNPAGSSKGKASAAEILRFLDSAASVRELARQLTKPRDRGTWAFTAGLLGSRDQDLVLQELEARLAAPDAALTQDYMWLLARMRFARSHAPLPPYPQNDVARQKSWLSRRNELFAELSKTDDALYQRAADSISVKQGAAKTTTVSTLLLRPYGPHADTRLPEAEAASAFLALTEQQQATLLEIFWARLKSPLMIAPLEAVLDKPHASNQELRTVALDRLLDVNPEKGAVRILAEIREPHLEGVSSSARFARCLSKLPNETLPELDELLANRLKQRASHTKDLDAQLIGRYATGSILSRVKSLYKSGSSSWDCDAEDGFLRYFLREDTAYGMSRFAIRGSNCTLESLNEVARMKRWPEVEPAFIHRLNDPNLWAARDAAEVLARFGGPNAKQAMLLRLRTFSETWKSRAKELRERPNMPNDVRDAISFQYGLVESLGRARGWVLNDDEIAETESLTLGEERENAGQWLSQSPVRLTVTISSDGRIHAEIGQYSADELPAVVAKLAQFQKGTRFLLSFSGAEEQRSPALRSINETARLHGLTVENSLAK